MKNLFSALAGLLLLGIGGPVVAAASPQADVFAGWNKPGPPPLERFVKPLALTPEQQQKLRPVFAAAQAQAAQDAAAAKSTDLDAKGSALLTREADFRVRLGGVLTPEQLQQYESLTEGRAANARTLKPHPAHGHENMNMSPPAEAGAAPAPPVK